MAKFLLFHPMNVAILIALFVINQMNAAPVNDTNKSVKSNVRNVCVIGAGVSGIASAKHLLDHGHNVTVFEQSEDIGGIWFYTNQTDKNKYGLKVHSPAYKGLSANVPSSYMVYPNFPYPNKTEEHPPQPVILKYMHSYADQFDIKKHIKLNHLVVRVLPIEDDKWEVIVKDLPNDRFQTFVYDYVFVCNGHFSSPYYPTIPGMDEFEGKMLHSHDFRTPETFRNESVLIIGDGASGRDIDRLLEEVANRTTLSGHRMDYNQTEEEREMRLDYLQNSRNKYQYAVKRFTSTEAEFIDGTNETFSVVIFATGYNYSYPMLSVDTGIRVNNNSVSPLYKQIFNIEHPSMVFIGVLSDTISFISYDFQFHKNRCNLQ
ncbi:dimethylaniline monooxygenase [N-oxide-forming] 3-like isoform X2 [Contarinia nasturtii]|uniref:dimethylaniline monooxygenase [N-oxide-forming] 3-like isoform X2 n=1 Tax=Contarinia nasturtii TaxID=265458 RepID=UPI0012D4856A|nr:dimethylaniline monooxygenase [N-oxide-forming] 3-like isoform X2 [Contarinia nasturtii]